jgi:hypothetical protein
MAGAAQLLTVVYVNADEGTEAALGQFEMGPDGQLTVVDAEPTVEEFLTGLADSLNEKDSVSVKVGGAERYALEMETYARGDANFLDGVKGYLKHFYSIELRSKDDLAARPDEFQGLTA